MGCFNEENNIALLAIVTVDHSGTGQTNLFTGPSGFRYMIDHVKVEAKGDEGETDITLGQVGALTDFMDTTQLDNLDAQYDIVTLRPIQADPPVKQKSYAAGTVFQVDVTVANGNAGNTYFVWGTLKPDV